MRCDESSKFGEGTTADGLEEDSEAVDGEAEDVEGPGT